MTSLHRRKLFGGGLVIDAETGALEAQRQPVEVIAGGIGVGRDSNGLVAWNLDTNARIWAHEPVISETGSSVVAAAGETVFWRRGARLETFDLRTGTPGWAARLPGGDESIQYGGVWEDFAIGDGLVLVPVGRTLWALSANAEDLPAKLRATHDSSQPVIYGQPARIEGSVTSDGISASHRVTLDHAEWPSRRYRRLRTKRVPYATPFSFAPKPSRNTALRVRVQGGNAKRFYVVVLPRFRTRRLDTTPGARVGRIRIDVRVPRSVRLSGRTVGMYLGRGTAKRFTRLGAGRLSGGSGRYSASFSFTTLDGLGPKDFLAICVAGVHRQGMGYGMRLDRSCGAGSVRF